MAQVLVMFEAFYALVVIAVADEMLPFTVLVLLIDFLSLVVYIVNIQVILVAWHREELVHVLRVVQIPLGRDRASVEDLHQLLQLIEAQLSATVHLHHALVLLLVVDRQNQDEEAEDVGRHRVVHLLNDF